MAEMFAALGPATAEGAAAGAAQGAAMGTPGGAGAAMGAAGMTPPPMGGPPGGFDIQQFFSPQVQNLMRGDIKAFAQGVEPEKKPALFQQPTTGFDIMQLMFK